MFKLFLKLSVYLVGWSLWKLAPNGWPVKRDQLFEEWKADLRAFIRKRKP